MHHRRLRSIIEICPRRRLSSPPDDRLLYWLFPLSAPCRRDGVCVHRS
jgi:hypothetical protein